MSTTTLYQRMGGDAKMKVAVSEFLTEIGRDADLMPFFENISVSALGVHQIKLFRVIFGPDEEKPDKDEFLDFMLATHTRLFRDQGLNEDHFDKVAGCLVRAFQTMNYSQDIIDEVLIELGPLRAVFEHGAKVATQEKTYDTDELANLPTTTAASIGTDERTVLPDPAWIDTPDWLLETLGRYSHNDEVRAWTRNLIDRFGADGDKVIADTFMDMPYMNHHVYVCAMLQLAFAPEGTDPTELLYVVLYPRGPDKERLWAALWERMIDQFKDTCAYMMMDSDVSKRGVDNLLKYKSMFREGDVKLVGGVFAPHVLRRVVRAEFDVSAMQKIRKKKSMKSCLKGSNSSSTDSDSTSEATESAWSFRSLKSKTKRKGVWRRLLGWTKV